ncbi:LruC domain-containing protein [Vibrio mimicus]
MRLKLWCFIVLILVSIRTIAAPFETCPSKAYLFQASPVQVYGVNLVTGQTALLQSNTGLNGNINAVGFDFQDRYIYGYDTNNKRLVRLGSDFQVETLNTLGLPLDYTFFVGDVYNHVFYLYRQGKGLFKIDLSPLDSDPNAVLIVEQISTTATVNLTDFAFHPADGSLYGVDNSTGGLYLFDTDTGASSYIGNVGQTGTFGAGYFDVDGYYYISRNSDGKIFRINLSNPDLIAQGNVPAVHFADGPSSNQNDGARCANAPVIDEDSTIDFGDAPDSYRTTLASNGPRHQMDGVTWLGSAPDGEQSGQPFPASDDKAGIDDEDGVGFVTALEAGLEALITVNASTSGYLSAWFDWNRDGDFDDTGEQVFTDQLLNSGQNVLIFTVAQQATMGSSWSRFRFSQQKGLNAYGGSTSGEVEDYPITISANGVAIRYFPSETTYATVAFEDNWPHLADYDMNDVVIRYRVTETLQDNQVAQIRIDGYLAAYGAGYHNGFAIRLSGLARSAIDTNLTRQYHNDVLQPNSGLEMDSNEAIFIISEDLSRAFPRLCTYFRTDNQCTEDIGFNFSLIIAIERSSDVSQLIAIPYDPFIFATPGIYHGEGITFQPGRKWEVHLADYPATEKFDAANLYGAGVDTSDPAQQRFFKNANNLPWALLITDEWQWPYERSDLVRTYPQFSAYAQSAGQQKQSWFNNAFNNCAYCYNP